MGVYRMDYLMYGWKLPYDKDFVNDFYEREDCDDIHSKDIPFELVIDGMGGKYVVFGQLIDYCGEEEDGWDFYQIDLKNTEFKKPIEMIESFEKYTGADLNKMISESNIDPMPKLMLFSNYS